MKTIIRQLTTLLALAALAGAQTLFAQLNVPSDGSDGVLNITSNTVIDLSQAVTGTWSDDNTANSGKGVYDPAKWAVVFKYQSVNIANGAKVWFANHASHAPVVWLVQSNVILNGTVSLDGRNAVYGIPQALFPAEPGPGGFRGGAYSALGNGAGYGPGGGATSSDGASYVGAYGNPQILPLIGGSGNKGEGNGRAGNSAGGAILIVSAGTIALNGNISALGGSDEYDYYYHHYAHASGGAVRLIANQVTGSGNVSADRTRVEANMASSQLIITPNTVAVPPGTTPLIWPDSNAPVVSVVSVNSSSAPIDPLAGLVTTSDISIGTNSPVEILLQTQHFPPNGSVIVRVTPKYADFFNVNAIFQSGTFTNAIWKATTTLPNGFCVLQAHATSP
ncbi:MAG: hypothetical protein WCS94_21845 [Verrucomicrobiota bacterium]